MITLNIQFMDESQAHITKNKAGVTEKKYHPDYISLLANSSSFLEGNLLLHCKRCEYESNFPIVYTSKKDISIKNEGWHFSQCLWLNGYSEEQMIKTVCRNESFSEYEPVIINVSGTVNTCFYMIRGNLISQSDFFKIKEADDTFEKLWKIVTDIDWHMDTYAILDLFSSFTCEKAAQLLELSSDDYAKMTDSEKDSFICLYCLKHKEKFYSFFGLPASDLVPYCIAEKDIPSYISDVYISDYLAHAYNFYVSGFSISSK